MKTHFLIKYLTSLGAAAFAFLSTINCYSYHTRESTEPHPAPPPQGPWFTGPLIAPSAHVVSIGHFNIEPYLYFATFNGNYGPNWKEHSSTTLHHINVQVPIQVGITKRIDLSITPQEYYSWMGSRSSWEFGDLQFAADIQLLNDKPDKWWPAIRLSLKGNAPVGKYDHLDLNDPHKATTEGVGSGTWAPETSLAFGHLFHFGGVHYLNSRYVISYAFPTSTHVDGLNVYGGGSGTHGSITPGNILFLDLGLEYSLTQNWVLAMDFTYFHNDRTTFHGNSGKDANGNPNPIGSPSSEQFSLAPAFEYNWNADLGLIAGVWFTVAGRNSSEFVRGIVAYNIYY